MKINQIVQGKDSVEKIQKITRKILEKYPKRTVKILSYRMDFTAQSIKLGFSLN
jgi:predicted metal-dependent hydrolase